MKGKIYRACVQSVMVYGSETWALKASETQQLVRTERMMVRWMCGVSLRDKKTSLELLDRLAIVGVEERVRRCRPKWWHIERKSADDWVSKCRQLEVEGLRGRGRSRKTWMECVDDMGRLNLRKEHAQDRVVWQNGIVRTRPTHASMDTRTLNR